MRLFQGRQLETQSGKNVSKPLAVQATSVQFLDPVEPPWSMRQVPAPVAPSQVYVQAVESLGNGIPGYTQREQEFKHLIEWQHTVNSRLHVDKSAPNFLRQLLMGRTEYHVGLVAGSYRANVPHTAHRHDVLLMSFFSFYSQPSML